MAVVVLVVVNAALDSDEQVGTTHMMLAVSLLMTQHM